MFCLPISLIRFKPSWPAIIIAAMFCTSLACAQSVVIEVNDTASSDDDYLCWTPVKARARLESGAAAGNAAAQKITLASESDVDGGAVQFQAFQGERPTRETYAPAPAIVLNLPADGSWQPFWVAGANPSRGAKDARIVAKAENGTSLGSLPVMVRVRKNADKLTTPEIQILFDALHQLHRVGEDPSNSEYVPYARIHAAAANLEIHNSPLFLPWHRAFVLDLERRLQMLVPAVTLPYWRFDQPSTRLFVAGFMGETEPGVPFVPGPRFERWQDPELGKLVRDAAKSPTTALLNEATPDLFYPNYLHFSSQLETKFHKAVHSVVGGWLGDSVSPADPLFFLLHANVDRVWAHWQVKHDRFDSSDEAAYSSQGKYPGVGPDTGQHAKGAYAEDGMWPWSASSQGGAWPSADHPMPQSSHGAGASTDPTPASMIDYLDVKGRGLALGYCYDDIDFKGQVIAGLP